jgi:hypothetical protein
VIVLLTTSIAILGKPSLTITLSKKKPIADTTNATAANSNQPFRDEREARVTSLFFTAFLL